MVGFCYAPLLFPLLLFSQIWARSHLAKKAVTPERRKSSLKAAKPDSDSIAAPIKLPFLGSKN
ncbi:hypothetical protein ES288_A04G073600v1 [Gossypium darwinii]|uniref:Uncharacterized protein n=1 Tax=Gossypium darwinii TaxID=34276 RepID=A0A5D2GV31_GOSDA|nr:hypothetical protein ES288_A04G073600v1 [Gossypium darwinii]